MGKATVVDTGLEFLCIRRVLHASHSFLVLAPKVGLLSHALQKRRVELKEAKQSILGQ